MELIQKLVERRKRLGITQEELADMLGLHQSHISRMESKGAGLKSLEAVAFALGMELTVVELQTPFTNYTKNNGGRTDGETEKN